jgi:hypothetical protein
LHRLVGLGFEILGEQEIRVNHGSRVQQFLSVSLISMSVILKSMNVLYGRCGEALVPWWPLRPVFVDECLC